MSVGERGRAATLENALSLCGQFGLSRRNALSIINEMLEVIRNRRQHFADYGVAEREIASLSPSFMHLSFDNIL